MDHYNYNSSIYNNKIDSKQKIINGFIFTELKDKVFEYRCSVCNYVAHDNSELYKHFIRCHADNELENFAPCRVCQRCLIQ